MFDLTFLYIAWSPGQSVIRQAVLDGSTPRVSSHIRYGWRFCLRYCMGI
jgi:hypothetical protein